MSRAIPFNSSRLPRLLGVAAVLATITLATTKAIAAVPEFGPDVLVFDPAMTDVQQRVDAVFQRQESNQFGEARYALLFKPGAYRADVMVGFYTQVAGLGSSPDDVSITGGVQANAGWMKGNATCNFWRSVENLSVTPTGKGQVDTWAVSQGADLRRLHVRGNLKLWDGGWSSGGFLADSQIDGYVESGSQQQWCSRNDDWGSWRGGVWNMVFVGTNRPPAGAWPERAYTTVDRTQIIREKPYLTIDGDRYQVRVPALHAQGTRGRNWGSRDDGATVVPIEQFLIARPNRDTAATLNAALAAGKDLLLTPGIYHLSDAIHVTRPDTVVLGLGYPTLIPDGGTPAMVVDNVSGVKIGGVIFDAGAANSDSLLQVGQLGDNASRAADPTFLYDIVARTGGATAGRASTLVTINANNVVGDNLWLWRADHGAGAGWTTNPTAHGLIVNGNDVTCYGLFVEHCQQDQTRWNGNGGRVYLYQSELPYDPPGQTAWSHDGMNGFASYRVAPGVTTHEAWGLGIYSNFTDAPILESNAIEAPAVPGVRFHHMVTVRLSGQAGSGIEHVINGQGPPVVTQMKAQVE